MIDLLSSPGDSDPSPAQMRLQAVRVRDEVLSRGGFLIVIGTQLRVFRDAEMPAWVRAWLRANTLEMCKLLTLGIEHEHTLAIALTHSVHDCPCARSHFRPR